MQTKPNVILITSDQQRGDCIGAATGGVKARGVKTPNLDRLGQAGTRFATCITPHPMCQPARASILTGKLPYSHGVRDNGRDLGVEYAADGLAGVFAAAGYGTHFIGKAHFSSQETFAATGRAECYKSIGDFAADWDGPYFGFDTVELLLRPHHHCKWAEPPQTLHYENWLNADGRGEARWALAKEHVAPETSHFQVWRSALEDKWHSSPWVGSCTVAAVERATADPFFAWISFPDPHPPFLVAAPWSDMYDPRAVDIPKHRTLDLDRRPWWHRAFLESPVRRKKRPHAQGGVDWGDSGVLDERQLRDITAIYYGMISAIDHQVGRILGALEAKGLLDNTIVIYTSDHGEWLGDHGLLLKGPMVYDGLLRVPCLMQGPGVPAGRVVNDPVSTLDLRATLADLCGLTVAPDDGASLRPLMMGEETRDFALNEWEVDHDRSGVGMDLTTVRSERYRLSVDLRTSTGELYDLHNDPFEMDNLFDDGGAAAARAEMMDMITSRRRDTVPVSPRVGWH